MHSLVKKIDIQFDITVEYADNESVEPFISEDKFNYHNSDRQYLSGKVNEFPYVIHFQDEIKEEMETFFANKNFQVDFGNRMLNEPLLSTEFKNEFWKYFGQVIDINGIEEPLAKFLLDNNCDFSEELLYKFAEFEMSADLKTKLLAVAISRGAITDFEKFKKYFCSICDDYAEFWQHDKTIRLIDTPENRTIDKFMHDNKLIYWHSKNKNKIIIKSQK